MYLRPDRHRPTAAWDGGAGPRRGAGGRRPCPCAPWVVQAGTAVSHRTRHEAGNSVNVLRVPEADDKAAEGAGTEATWRRCVVERWDWNAEAQRFEAAQRHVLAWPA